MEGQYLHKRNKFQIYYDVLSGTNLKTNNGGGVKPTRVQVHSNLAYDKLVRYLKVHDTSDN
jgi:predicted transcriptional regulator